MKNLINSIGTLLLSLFLFILVVLFFTSLFSLVFGWPVFWHGIFN